MVDIFNGASIEVSGPATPAVERPTSMNPVDLHVVPVVGPPGPSADTRPLAYEHTQTTPSSVWDIVHNLGWKPAGVRVRDLDGNGYRGQIAYIDDNTVRITLSDSILGTAYLS